MYTSKLRDSRAPRVAIRAMFRPPRYQFEGIVLRRGVKKFLYLANMTRLTFHERSGVNNTTLHRAYHGRAPRRLYVYLWQFMHSAGAVDCGVPIYDPGASDAD